MSFSVSPGVSVSEYDNTNKIPVTGTSVGAFAGDFAWGPANKRISIGSENQLVATFQQPTNNTYSSFFSASNFLAYTNNLVLVRSLNANSYNATANTGQTYSIANKDVWEISYSTNSTALSDIGAFVARYPGSLGNSLSVSVCASPSAFKTPSLSVTTVASSNTVTVTSGFSGTSFASTYPNFVANDIIIINGTSYTISSITANTIVTSVPVTSSATTTAKVTWKYASTFSAAPGTSVYGAAQGATNDEISIAVIDTNGLFTGVKGYILETFDRLSKATDAITDDGTNNYFNTVILNKSKYIYNAGSIPGASNWNTVALNTTFNSSNNYTVQLSGGTDVTSTDADKINAYQLFANPEEVTIDLLISGEANATVADAILTLANQRKDCVAFVSPLRQDAVTSVNVDNIIAYRNTLTPSTSYSVMDSGFKYQFDRYNNMYRYVPLNADVAGLCARTDKTNASYWSPAGYNRGQILNAVKLSWNPSQANRDDLYQAGINPVCAFPGQGVVLFGDKTMQAKASAFDRINVRRLFITLERTISTAAKYSLFEFNDSFTQAAFVALVDPYLRSIKAGKGIYNYQIVCDATNNTQSVVDQNGFVGDIYIQPAKSINYIQLNFTAVNSGVNFTEVAGVNLG